MELSMKDLIKECSIPYATYEEARPHMTFHNIAETAYSPVPGDERKWFAKLPITGGHLLESEHDVDPSEDRDEVIERLSRKLWATVEASRHL